MSKNILKQVNKNSLKQVSKNSLKLVSKTRWKGVHSGCMDWQPKTKSGACSLCTDEHSQMGWPEAPTMGTVFLAGMFKAYD